MKIEVNESVRSFVTEDSDEPALGGKIHTSLGITRAALVTKYLFKKLQASETRADYMCNFQRALLMECGLPFELPLSSFLIPPV